MGKHNPTGGIQVFVSVFGKTPPPGEIEAPYGGLLFEGKIFPAGGNQRTHGSRADKVMGGGETVPGEKPSNLRDVLKWMFVDTPKV